VTVLRIDQDGALPEGAFETLAAQDAVIYGSPTYMGGPAWQFMFESEDPDPEDRSLRPWGLQVSKREDGIHDQ